MTSALASLSTLRTLCDNAFPANGVTGYVALLKSALISNFAITANATTDTITGATHGLVTGSRVRVASTATVPSPLVAGIDYYAILVSATEIRLATSLADAVAATAINLIDAGSGSLTINEQTLNKDDSQAVLLNKELTHPAWTQRLLITNLGPAITVGPNAEKLPLASAIQNNNAAPLTYRHVLLLLGSGVSATIGSAAGITGTFLASEASDLSINQGEIKSLVFKFRSLPA
jgi:hypothetical protein